MKMVSRVSRRRDGVPRFKRVGALTMMARGLRGVAHSGRLNEAAKIRNRGARF